MNKKLNFTKIAAHFGVTQQAVSNWFNRCMPVDRVIPVCKHLKWKVTPHSLRPDIYPGNDDGLPSLLRGRKWSS